MRKKVPRCCNRCIYHSYEAIPSAIGTIIEDKYNWCNFNTLENELSLHGGTKFISKQEVKSMPIWCPVRTLKFIRKKSKILNKEIKKRHDKKSKFEFLSPCFSEGVNIMYTYMLGLVMGGLMEDPQFHIENTKTVSANNLREAKDKWAKITGEDKLTTWDKESQTVWGWNIKVTCTDDPNVAKDEYFTVR